MSFRTTLPLFGFLLGLTAFACVGDEPSPSNNDPTGNGTGTGAACTTNDQCAAGTETCDTASGKCVAGAAGAEIGTGDGSPASVTFTEIYSASKRAELVDLSFAEKDPTQLWVIGYGDSTVHVGTGVSGDEKGTWKEYYDPAAVHFMYKPPAIAMGEKGLWGICGDNDNAHNDPRREPNYFMGPALFTSDLEIFTTQNQATGLGSHYDMLHNTSFCRGIAHMEANIFWTFNGQLDAIEKYNFNKPHEPGGDDHSDGEIYRYVEGQVKGVEGVSSHLFYDPSDKMLYIADTGNKRIAKLDTTAGTLGERLPLRNEQLKKNGVMDGATVEDVVPAGTLEQPSGIEVKNGLIYVTDTATATFHVFDKTGKEIRKLETGLKAGALSGFIFGPDGKIYFTDRNRGKVVRIDPVATPE
ncbi:MAG: hypothetical protein KF764_13630 [Labilithrix sp.]|nr:hypothetical protein [Labilithrix sp.]MBX3221683.1 hypothetical protein [Labilithrix sp.]